MKKQEGVSGALAALSRDIEALVAQAGPWVVSLGGRPGLPTSGIIWKEGIVVASNHTLVRDEEVEVRFDDGAESTAEIAGRDPGTDLALLKVSTGSRESAPVLDGAALTAGQLVVSVGRNSEHGLRTSLGVIGGVGGEWHTGRGGTIDQYILLDMALFPGFSGGPLLDGEGKVVGVNSSGLSRQSGVSLPISTVKRVLAELLESGHVKRGYLGVGLYPVRLPESLRKEAQAEAGLLIVGVEEGSGAERAGVLVGDIFLTIDGKAVADPEQLHGALGSGSVGKSVEVNLLRGGKRVGLPVEVGERPARGH